MADFCRPDPDPAKEATSVKMAQWKGHGDALDSIVKMMNEDPDKVNRLGMGLLMFVEILKVEARLREQ